MAKVNIPFCATAELQAPYMLDEDYANPNGVKSVLIDKSRLQVMAKQETVEVPDVGPLQVCIFYIVGTISYFCNAFPVVQSDTVYDVQQDNAPFNDQLGNTAPDCVQTTTSNALGWISAAGCVHVNEPVGGDCSIDNLPVVTNVTVENFAVGNNPTSELSPTCSEASCGEETKRVVKWRGCFVITTSE